MRIPIIGKCIILAFVILLIPLSEIGLISLLLWKLPVDKAHHTLSYLIPILTAASVLPGLLFAMFVGSVLTRRIRQIQNRIDRLNSKTSVVETPVVMFSRDELTDLEESVANL